MAIVEEVKSTMPDQIWKLQYKRFDHNHMRTTKSKSITSNNTIGIPSGRHGFLLFIVVTQC
jgi:hypothetical protein